MPSLFHRISRAWKLLLFDALFRISASIFFTLALLYIFPIIEEERFLYFIDYHLDLILFSLLVVAAADARLRFRYRRERDFFFYLGWSYIVWIFLKMMYLIPSLEEISYSFVGDIFYLFFYGFQLRAAGLRPSTPRSGKFSRTFRWNQSAAPLLLTFALFLYFVFVPATFNLGYYDSSIPSFFFFVILDFFLCMRFAVLMTQASSQSWKTIYFFMSLSTAAWGLIDFIQALHHIGMIDLPDISKGDIFWYLPYVFFILGTRVKAPPQVTDKMPTWIRDQDRADAGSLPLVYAFSLPLLHYTAYATGLFKDGLEAQRDVVIALWLLVMGTMTIIQQRIINTRTGLLETMRSRNVQLLKAIGLIQSRFIEAADADEVFAEQVKQAAHLSESNFCMVAEIRDSGDGRHLHVLSTGRERQSGKGIPVSELNAVFRQALDRGLAVFENDATLTLLEPICSPSPGCRTVAFMPLLHGKRLVGAMALCGRSAGYDRQLVRYLEPYMKTCAGIISAFHNERERLRIADRVRRFNQILDESLEEIYIFEARSLQFLQVNRGARENLGYTKAQLSHMTPPDLIPDLDAENYRELLAPLYDKSKEKVFFTVEHRRRDGTTYPVDVYVQPSTMESVPVFVAFAVDITQRRDMEAERDQLTAQVIQAQKMETVGTLAGGIAHDFNNVLAPIIWCSEMMLKEMPPEKDVKAGLEHMLLAARRARDLIQQLLTFSRRSVRKSEPVYLSDIIEETLNLLQATRPRNVIIDYRPTQRGDRVLADPLQMQQVIMNLCTNAFYAMRENGGRIGIELDSVEISKEYARKFPDLNVGRFVRMRVSDNGPGMEPDTLEHIFEPFFTTKPVGEGTGLGLAVIHGIILSHGGAVTVESEPGEGTCFQIFLSPHRGSVEVESVEPEVAPELCHANILLVDDEAEVVRAARIVLEDAGFEVTAETDSVEALNRFRARPESIDLVITDHVMPRMNGLQLAAKLIAIRPDLPVILTTGIGGGLEQENLQVMGIQAVVSKSMDSKILTREAARILSKHRDQATGRARLHSISEPAKGFEEKIDG
ncbi:MAG: ATP-binding protein [Acidobacteriota bacterium]|nr:ATP-binding protein [Acidobacteriota bacterium]